jgi:mannose-1-phosphate guanylyltransferase
MFMFQPQILINEFTIHSPDIVSAVSDAVNNATQDLDFIRLEKQAFEFSPSDSIDYALLEKSNNVIVVPLDAGWSDIGSWSALYDISAKDDNGNVIKGDVVTQDTVNTYNGTATCQVSPRYPLLSKTTLSHFGVFWH